MVAQAKVLADMLRENQNPDRPFEVIVSGHTDNQPISNARYPSNWYLSVQRAVNFLNILLDNGQTGLAPQYFSTRGYGEYEPIASNDTVDGRMQNRRVELLISQGIIEDQTGSAVDFSSGGTPPVTTVVSE
jgi:chemotaxis protein MotB